MIQHGSARVVFASVVVCVLVFLTLPSILMAVASFSAGTSLTFPPQGFSLRWYGAMVTDRALTGPFLNSACIALVCTAVSTIAGTCAAISLARYRLPFRGAIELYFLLPFTIPLAVEAVGLLNLSGAAGLLGNRWAIGVAIAAVNLPFVTSAVAAAGKRLDPYLEDAAAICGAHPIERFLTVTIPSLMPGILAGALIMFISALNEFVVSSFLVDVRSMTLPVQLFNQTRGVATPMIASVSVAYTLISIAAVVLIDRLVGIRLFLGASR